MPNISNAYFDGIAGSCEQEGREESVQILSMDHKVEIPVDVKDATATGTRRHGAMKLVANIDKATSQIMKCLCTSTPIPEVKIEFWNNPEGEEVNYFTIIMKTVRVTGVRVWYPNVDDEDTTTYKDMVDYHLRYDEIEWIYTDGNLSFKDNWKNPPKK